MKKNQVPQLKKLGKQDRERQVLLGLVEYYIKTGKPVGSHSLQEAGFGELSSATLRNYFAALEEEGFLSQSHSSGGRIPTDLAYKTYAQNFISEDKIDLKSSPFESIRKAETREVSSFLQHSAESLSQHSKCAVFISAPRFDHDFVVDIKLVSIDSNRCICILVTDFGVVKTEILPISHKLTALTTKKIENFFHWRLTGLDQPESLSSEELALAQNLYHEVMVRYIVGYSNFIDEDIYRIGFSKLLSYPEFQDATLLASSLSLFENTQGMRLLLRASLSTEQLKCWIGEDLNPYSLTNPECSVITIPYFIGRTPVGSIGLLGPKRISYRDLFKLLQQFSLSISEALTKNLYKYKVSFRQPEKGTLYLQKEEQNAIGQKTPILIEDKRH